MKNNNDFANHIESEKGYLLEPFTDINNELHFQVVFDFEDGEMH